ncbi:DUF2585 family protein [Enterovirga rhinocerotis]|uniref:Uncharacterized protein DUF2585 n=1 Tax=Enterovirga rhinocerotis TaxID=1339210 RepID=A0A4R7BX68_9HYPH|nr:DUF2585 family protein [Enterovirga rhinocerotis]TDR90103.1 uncharacterized protein DUF2585 [Enterovirga rhinocerotis]
MGGGSLVAVTRTTLVCLALLGATALVLHAMGRPWSCACGHVALWHGDPASSENSQHLTDWYSFTHVIHGFLFYALAWGIGRLRGSPLPAGVGFMLAILLECAWEIVENTPWIVERYRAETVSLGYNGDSVVNSLGDIAATALGYGLAATLPVALIVVIALVIEVALAWLIRDNLTLNVLMLLHPVESVKAWQAGTGK